MHKTHTFEKYSSVISRDIYVLKHLHSVSTTQKYKIGSIPDLYYRMYSFQCKAKEEAQDLKIQKR
jgi:hypothetical protein